MALHNESVVTIRKFPRMFWFIALTLLFSLLLLSAAITCVSEVNPHYPSVDIGFELNSRSEILLHIEITNLTVDGFWTQGNFVMGFFSPRLWNNLR